MTVDVHARVRAMRAETRTELELLHQRVNTVLAAEAFLTIAYTASMGSQGRWATVTAPVLAGLGLLLALLAWPGVRTTAGLVSLWTRRVGELLESVAAPVDDLPDTLLDRRRNERSQRQSLLLFRCVPPVFGIVWTVLLVVSLTLRG
jgi:hypothetical protein